MEMLAYNAFGLVVHILRFIQFSGYVGYRRLDLWHYKWGQNISRKK
jgi:hypothetical protein